MNFDKWTYLGNQHYNKDIEQFHHPQKFPVLLCVRWQLPPHPWPQATLNPHFAPID